MKRILAIVCAFFVLAGTAGPVHARNSSLRSPESLAGSLVSRKMATGAVLSIVENGTVSHCGGYGSTSPALGIPADGDSSGFRIGSVSKTFVAVAALQLAQQNLLDLHEDISIYLEPDFPRFPQPVTMHQLLTHTAGFEDRITGMAVPNVSDTQPLSGSVREHRPAQVFSPGEVVSYSNYGTALAAYTIERISGTDFAQYCEENIFLPLGMEHTTFRHMQDVVAVSGAFLADGSETVEPYMNLYPEGSAVSTARDMAHYMLWLLDPEDQRVLSPEWKSELFFRQAGMEGDQGGLGYIWNRNLQNGNVYLEKIGETLCFRTRILLFPETRTGIFLSVNTPVSPETLNAFVRQATDLQYGVEDQDYAAGEATLDIRGHYVSNWSVFTTPEKIIRFLVPGKTLDVAGSPESGYRLNGESLLLTGPDTYRFSMGTLVFRQESGTIQMSNGSAITYRRMGAWQRPPVQLALFLFFLLLPLLNLIRILCLRKQKTSDTGKYSVILPLVQVLVLAGLAALTLFGILNYNLLDYMPWLRAGAIVLLGSAIILATWILRRFREGINPGILPLLWLLSSLGMGLWLIWLRYI